MESKIQESEKLREDKKGVATGFSIKVCPEGFIK